jgi:hypothetical protein
VSPAGYKTNGTKLPNDQFNSPLCVHCDMLKLEHADSKCLYINSSFELTECNEYVDSYGTQCEGVLEGRPHDVMPNWLEWMCNNCGMRGSRPRRP